MNACSVVREELKSLYLFAGLLAKASSLVLGS